MSVWSPYSKLQINQVEKFRGQQPAGPAGNGETQVVSARCLTSLSGHLLGPVGSSLLLFHKIHSGALSIEKRQVPDTCSQFEINQFQIL